MSHAKLSPSSSARWIACPASIKRSEGVPGRPSGPAAIDGTHSHTLLEHCIQNGLKDPVLCIGQQFTDHEGSFTVDLDRAKRVLVAINYLKQRKSDLELCSIRAESRVDAGQLIGRDDINGTADVQIIHNDCIEVVDYKDGVMPVDPEWNTQMGIYAMGVLAELGSLFGETPVRMTIVQPKLELKGLDPVNSFETTVNKLNEWFYSTVKPAAEKTGESDLPGNPGDHCKWCPAKSNCAEYMKGEDVSEHFQNANGQMTDAEKVQMIQQEAALKQKLKDIEELKKEFATRLDNGEEIEGLKLVAGRGSRKWNMTEEEMADKLKRMGVPKSAMYVTKLVSPSAVKKMSWTKKGSDDARFLSDRQLKTLDENYVAYQPGKPTVALSDDPRDVVSPTNVAQHFESVEEDKPALPAWFG